MKHAGNEALDQLEGLLARIRAFDSLKEVKRGVFYKRSKPFLHFHEDPKGLFADLMKDGVLTRLCATSAGEQEIVLREIGYRIAEGSRS